MYLLDIPVFARKAAGTPLVIATGFEQKFWQIQAHDPLFDNLKIAISERDEALAELMRITEEQKRREDDVRVEAKKVTSKLEEEILNGRKLIEDLQSDKRRDRQLLLELRAQLVRPTHAVPPTHINPLRFGGSAQAVYGAPAVAIPSATIPTNLLASPKGTLTKILPPNPPQASLPTISSATAVNQDVDLPFDALPRRPIFRLPPQPLPRRIIPAQQPALSFPPPNAPKGPKGWKPSEGLAEASRQITQAGQRKARERHKESGARRG